MLIKDFFNISIYFKRLAREGSIVILTNIVQFLDKILILYILARAFDVNEFGIYGLAITINGLFSQLLFGPFLNGFSRFNPVSFKLNQEENFLSSIFILWLRFSLYVILFSIFVIPIIFLTNKTEFLKLFCIVILYSFLSNFIELIATYFQSLRYRFKVLLIRICDAAFKIFFLSLIGITSIEMVFIYYNLTFIIIMIFNIKFLKKLLSLKFNIKTKYWNKKLLKFIKPFLYWGVFLWIYLNSGKWLLEFIDSTENVGFYNGIYQIGYTSILLIGSTINTFLLPILFQKTNVSGKSEIDLNLWYNRIIKFGIITALLIAFLTSLISKEVILFILGNKFLDVNSFLPYMILSGCLYSLSNVISGFSMAKNKPEILINVNIFNSIISSLMTLILIYYYSIYGAVIGLLFSSIIYFFSIHLKVKQVL